MKTDRRVEKHLGHELVAAKKGDVYQGVAWKDKKRVYDCAGSSLDDVVSQLRRYVDQKYEEVARQRTEAPDKEEYVQAFREIVDNLTDRHLAMLKAHYNAPDQTLTASELAKAAGYSTHSAANLQYGKVGKLVHQFVLTDLHERADGTPVYSSALATPGDTAPAEEHWAWTLRPQVAYAIERLGLVRVAGTEE